ncbi:MAG: cation transporter [Candidatus Izemoplasmataceae bacterium]
MKNSRQRTLWLSVIFSAFGPFVLIIALTMNTSTTQFADFIRRTTELFVLVLALWTYKKLENSGNQAKDNRYKYMIYLASGIVLWLSSMILSYLLIQNLMHPVYPEGNVIIGLSVAGLGIIFNGYFAVRYTLFNKETPHAVMDTQGKLYQAKTIVDVNVFIALFSVLLFSNIETRYWIDNIGTMIIIGYLFYRGFKLILESDK